MALTSLVKKNNIQLVQESINKYVVRPLNALGISGFLFDVEGEAEIHLESDITDHYCEDNVARQDHIALKPEKIVLKNYVGELRETVDDNTKKAIASIAAKLTVINNFAPAVANGVKNLKSTLKGTSDFNQSLSNVTDLWSMIKNMNPFASQQQKAYVYFKALRDQKILVSVQTPFEFVTNCAIQTIRAHQEDNSQDISDFTITLKQINFVSAQTTAFDKNKYQGRNAQQRSPAVNKGKASMNTTAYDLSTVIAPLKAVP